MTMTPGGAPRLTREIVSSTVAQYGKAWTAQDATLASSLFTKDAVYVERAYDRSATFRGRDAIESYWSYQICGKQSNIVFRHVESDMILDAERPNVAVVKWLAEFDNRREMRGPAKTAKRVRIVQLAVLHFDLNDGIGDDDDGGSSSNHRRISYLEEYATDCSGGASKNSKSGIRWPGIESNISDQTLTERMRFDPPPPPKPVTCTICSQVFSSRTRLFRHLAETVERTDGDEGGMSRCVPRADLSDDDDDENGPGAAGGDETDNGGRRRRRKPQLQTVCLSVSYARPESVDEDLKRAIGSLLLDPNDDNKGNHKSDATTTAEPTTCHSAPHAPTLSWAVPPTLVPTAVLNVAAIRIPRRVVHVNQTEDEDGPQLAQVQVQEELSARLNELLLPTRGGGCGGGLTSAVAVAEGVASEDPPPPIVVHGAELTDRMPFLPSRRESERYYAFVPWSVLQNANGSSRAVVDGEEERDATTAEKQAPASSVPTVPMRSQPKLRERSGQDDAVGGRRVDFDATAASAVVENSVAKRLMRGTRIVTDARHSLFGMSEESTGDSVRGGGKPQSGPVLNRVRTSVMDEPWHTWCRVSVSMRQPSGGGWVERIVGLLVAFARGAITADVLLERLTTEPGADQQGGSAVVIEHFPSEFVCLAEPVMNRYKKKAGVSLCGSSGGGAGKCSDAMRASVEAATDRALTIMGSIEKENGLIQDWCDRLDESIRQAEPSNESPIDST